jgi:hypothetical protein
MSKKFKISEKHLWMIRLEAYVENQDWNAVQLMAREKKNPPIPWQVFAEVAIEKNKYDLATDFIKKINNLEDQINMFLEIE